jgi:hypothetical protein
MSNIVVCSCPFTSYSHLRHIVHDIALIIRLLSDSISHILVNVVDLFGNRWYDKKRENRELCRMLANTDKLLELVVRLFLF